MLVVLTFHHSSEDQKIKFKCANISPFFGILEKKSCQKKLSGKIRDIVFYHLRTISNNESLKKLKRYKLESKQNLKVTD